MLSFSLSPSSSEVTTLLTFGLSLNVIMWVYVPKYFFPVFSLLINVSISLLFCFADFTQWNTQYYRVQQQVTRKVTAFADETCSTIWLYPTFNCASDCPWILVLHSQTTLPMAEGIYRRNSLSASLGMAMLTIREYAYSASLGDAW